MRNHLGMIDEGTPRKDKITDIMMHNIYLLLIKNIMVLTTILYILTYYYIHITAYYSITKIHDDLFQGQIQNSVKKVRITCAVACAQLRTAPV